MHITGALIPRALYYTHFYRNDEGMQQHKTMIQLKARSKAHVSLCIISDICHAINGAFRARVSTCVDTIGGSAPVAARIRQLALREEEAAP
jgi:hypothetical protein